MIGAHQRAQPIIFASSSEDSAARYAVGPCPAAQGSQKAKGGKGKGHPTIRDDPLGKRAPFSRTIARPHRRPSPYNRAVTALSSLREELDTLRREKLAVEAELAAAQQAIAEKDALIAAQAQEIDNLLTADLTGQASAQRAKAELDVLIDKLTTSRDYLERITRPAQAERPEEL